MLQTNYFICSIILIQFVMKSEYENDNNSFTCTVVFAFAPWFFFKISALYKSFTYLLTYKASIRWQESVPPISGYWPNSEPNAG